MGAQAHSRGCCVWWGAQTEVPAVAPLKSRPCIKFWTENWMSSSKAESSGQWCPSALASTTDAGHTQSLYPAAGFISEKSKTARMCASSKIFETPGGVLSRSLRSLQFLSPAIIETASPFCTGDCPRWLRAARGGGGFSHSYRRTAQSCAGEFDIP